MAQAIKVLWTADEPEFHDKAGVTWTNIPRSCPSSAHPLFN